MGVEMPVPSGPTGGPVGHGDHVPMVVKHAWIRRFVDDFENNPDFQVKFHLAMMIFWMVNATAGTVVMFLWPNLWLQVGVYYVFMLSIYANWDTDYDAVSAGKAFKHAKRAADER